VDLIVKGGTDVMLRYSSIVSFFEAGVIASTSPPGANDQTAPDVKINSRSWNDLKCRISLPRPVTKRIVTASASLVGDETFIFSN
jgi:hypothetical protein